MSHATEQLANLRRAGFFILAWSPDEMEGMDDQAQSDMEDRLIMLGNNMIEEMRVDVEEDDTCPTCQGCGEGMYDGSRCSTCKGKGVIRPETEWSE